MYSKRVPDDCAYLIGLDVNVLQIHVYCCKANKRNKRLCIDQGFVRTYEYLISLHGRPGLFEKYHNKGVGRDNSVGIATGYGLDGPGIESRWRRDFPRPSRPALGPAHPPIQCVPDSYPGCKAAGTWR